MWLTLLILPNQLTITRLLPRCDLSHDAAKVVVKDVVAFLESASGWGDMSSIHLDSENIVLQSAQGAVETIEQTTSTILVIIQSVQVQMNGRVAIPKILQSACLQNLIDSIVFIS